MRPKRQNTHCPLFVTFGQFLMVSYSTNTLCKTISKINSNKGIHVMVYFLKNIVIMSYNKKYQKGVKKAVCCVLCS